MSAWPFNRSEVTLSCLYYRNSVEGETVALGRAVLWLRDRLNTIWEPEGYELDAASIAEDTNNTNRLSFRLRRAA